MKHELPDRRRDRSAAVTTDRRSSLALAASTTNRPEPSENQDAFAVLDAERDGCTAVVVADGVGSWAMSGIASRAVVDDVADVLRQQGADGIEAAFAAAWSAVQRLVPEADGPEEQCGTTLLVAAVTPSGAIRAGYVGNGALLTVVPVPGAAPESAAMFWSNLLVPHSGYQHGREVLTRSYSTMVREAPVPTWITFDPGRPSAFLVVSDGIWSEEQNPLARTADGMRWAQRPPILMRSLELALAALVAFAQGVGPGELAEELLQHLHRLRAEGLLDDDATVGLLLT